MTDSSAIQRAPQKRSRLSQAMEQRLRRQWATAEAMDLSWGGAGAVSRADGLRQASSRRGRKSAGRGRKRLIETDPRLPAALESLMNPTGRGQSEPVLLWTCRGTGQLASDLTRRDHPVCDRTVASLLRTAGYTLQDKRRCNEGSLHTERDAQFAHISAQATAFQRVGEPVIWVEASRPAEIDRDIARFTTGSVARWWREMGAWNFPKCSRILIAADAGGSHARRNRLWRAAFQDLADELDLALAIRHFPPATTRWSKIEHCLTRTGRAAANHEIKVHLIASASSVEQNAPAPVAEWSYTLRPRAIAVHCQYEI